MTSGIWSHEGLHRNDVVIPGKKNRWTLISITMGLVILPCVLLLVLNNPSIYNQRELFVRYTQVSLSEGAKISRFDVKNFYYLDGPDFFYELRLSAGDKEKLIKLFDESDGRSANTCASELVPASWVGEKPRKIQHYFLINPKRAPNCWFFLDVDSESDRVWFVILTL